MQEIHSVEAEMKIHIKSQSVLCTGELEWTKLSGFPGTLWLKTHVLGKWGKWDSFKVRMQPLALRARRYSWPGWAAQWPCNMGVWDYIPKWQPAWESIQLLQDPCQEAFISCTIYQDNWTQYKNPPLQIAMKGLSMWLNQGCLLSPGFWTQL